MTDNLNRNLNEALEKLDANAEIGPQVWIYSSEEYDRLYNSREYMGEGQLTEE